MCYSSPSKRREGEGASEQLGRTLQLRPSLASPGPRPCWPGLAPHPGLLAQAPGSDLQLSSAGASCPASSSLPDCCLGQHVGFLGDSQHSVAQWGSLHNGVARHHQLIVPPRERGAIKRKDPSLLAKISLCVHTRSRGSRTAFLRLNLRGKGLPSAKEWVSQQGRVSGPLAHQATCGLSLLRL